MGLLTFSLILYIIKAARQRFSRSGTRLKDSILGQEADEGGLANMGAIKDNAGRPQDRAMDTRWADGLRGIAAVGVVSSHICLSFFQQLITPTLGGTDGTPMLFQRPIFRIVCQGQGMVALFFILMGFVNSLKPLKQAQAGQLEDALLTLARSALNRSARLFLPAAVMTCIAWLACQLRLNEISRNSDAYWLYHTTQIPSPSWWDALVKLKDALIECWVQGENPYDQPQWALKWLLVGSFWVFCVLLMTATTRPLFRVCVILSAYTYAWFNVDYILGTNVYFGVLLAQIHTLLTSSSCPAIFKRAPNTLTRIIPLFTALLGVYLMCYPTAFASDAAWCRQLAAIAARIAPARADVPPFFAALGAQTLCTSIYFSPLLQRALTHRVPCYLGSVSFSMYLLHGPLMRSVLAALVFGPAWWRKEVVLSSEGALRYPIPARWTMFFTIPLFAVILMAFVHVWASKVEPVFARVTKSLENFATGRRAGEGPKSPLHIAIVNGKKGDGKD